MTEPTPSTAAARAAEPARDRAELLRETASNAAAPAASTLPPDDPVSATPATPATRSQWRDVWAQFRSHTGAMIALVLFVAILLFVLVDGWVLVSMVLRQALRITVMKNREDRKNGVVR